MLVLPLALWFAWYHWWGRRRAGTRDRAAPWTMLGLAGLLLVVMSLVGATLFEGGAPGSTYHPTRVEPDGRVVPGGFEE